MQSNGLSMLVHGLAPLLISCAFIPGVQAETGSSSDRPSVTITVNPSLKHAISPYIYGINFFTKIEGVPAALTLDRTGGNRWTAYNWVTNASNAGSDYQYENDAYLSPSKEPGAAVSELIAADRKSGLASLVTVQLQGLVAGDESGPVSTANPPDRTRFKRVFFAKSAVSNKPFTVAPPASEESVYVDEFVWALDRKFAGQNIFGAHPSTHPVFVSLDNEPDLWNSTHLEIQGKTNVSSDSLITRTVAAATALKQQFPDMVIFGPANSGFMGIYSWNGELSTSPSGIWFTDKYLSALKKASTIFGRPLVDVYDFHWYPEATDGAGKRITGLMGPDLTDDQVQAIVQSPRSLWDKTYKEKSWIANDVLGQPIDLLDRLQTRIDDDYPGMKLALTEYDNGGGQHIAGTIAQADNLGIFGVHDLFAATLWLLSGKEPYSLAGFRAFRNFDGAGHHFGDTSVQASSSNAAEVSAYVSTDSGRAGRVVMVAINRTAQPRTVAITGQPLSGMAHLFQMTAASAAKQTTIQPTPAGIQPVAGSSIKLSLPALSVTTVDVY